MNLQPTRLRTSVHERKQYLVHQLWKLGYTQDRIGKKTEDMTLTELEQVHINVKCQKAREKDKR
ncbi:hypothetical protein [Thalassobacillus sp. CUG 92003]|uniref:hypothetical protein n=1 Tax=Thalassobacillus sp. CUG 92003 TaxID=2736641 RepID=UPI0015E74C6C|nr:hypothetical protein [Thalassobacillus sp. CUG 92003]